MVLTYHYIFDCKPSIVILQKVIFGIDDFQYLRYWRDSLSLWINDM